MRDYDIEYRDLQDRNPWWLEKNFRPEEADWFHRELF